MIQHKNVEKYSNVIVKGSTSGFKKKVSTQEYDPKLLSACFCDRLRAEQEHWS